MYIPGTSLFIKAGIRTANIRTAPSKNSKAIPVGKTGDPAAGKYLGKFKRMVESEGYKWLQLDYPQPRFIDSQLVQDITADVAKNQSVFSKPNTRLKIYESINAAKPLLEIEAARLVGYVNRTVQAQNGTWIVLNPVGSTTVPWYVKSESVTTESQVKESIRQAILNDQVIFKTGLLLQDQFNKLRKKGTNVDQAELKLAAIMSRYNDRQKIWDQYKQNKVLEGNRTLDDNTRILFNKLKKDSGISAISWVGYALIALLAVTVVGAISVSLYKSFWENRPDKASAADANLLLDFWKEMTSAKSDPEREKVLNKFQGKLQDEKQKGYDEGEKNGKDSGFLNNLGDSFGTIAGGGVVIGIGYYLFFPH